MTQRSAFDGLGDWIENSSVELAAQEVARLARERGWTTADKIELINEDGFVDMARVRARANELLAEN